MKIRALALVGASALLLAIPSAASAGQGWYLGLGAGWDHMKPIDFTTAPPLAATGSLKQSDGYIVSGALGFKWSDGWRLEVEGAFDSHNQQHATPPFVGNTLGHNKVDSVMANLTYDWNLFDRLNLTLGGGLGWGWLNMNIEDSLFPGQRVFHGTQSALMWQGIAGLSYEIAPQFDIYSEYRYRSLTLDKDYPSDFVGLTPIRVSRAQEHVAMIGFRYYLEGAEAPPPAPMPPPPPPPPPPAVKTFIVFFDFDKSNLTAEAQSVVTEAVKAAKDNGWVKVEVTGHTDTVGSDTYNQALSERRADAVKDEMVRQGMSADGVMTQGKSFHDPLVATGPGVREPQNRRAVIEY